ncbi:hypothetical protein BJ994_000438 [Arthrobacter pigmenti]|uniref:Lipoprotein n=1 Tax=Arthrobacter pigmenti TaxID=271432 RepID=A0A846RL33_9MICC|nr:hypothetical protein [Arthrobacter pigmenti]NJC21362.1 hypothetical protein [Arthrobacter pigmenti]
MTTKRSKLTRPRAVVVGLTVLSLTGCGSSADGARDTAAQFQEAIAGGDTEAACGLLAPTTVEELESTSQASCPDALSEVDLEAAGDPAVVEVYGRNAQVKFPDDALFLTESGQDWLVIAAGCTPRGDRPYDCEVKGD